MLIVANRLPVSVTRQRDGNYNYQASPGGLASALSALGRESKIRWIGWPGLMDPKQEDIEPVEKKLQEQYDAIPVFLTRKQIHRYYYGFSNSVLWPVLHYLTDHTHYNERDYIAYIEVNRIFSEKIAEVVKNFNTEDIVWIHDYQLMLLPAMLRKAFPELRIGFFLHTPFPSSEVFRSLPYREELLQGILGSTLVGLQTFSYQRHFASSVLHILGIEPAFDSIQLDTHTVHMGTFPISIDVQKIRKTVTLPSPEEEQRTLHYMIRERKLILSVDRLDYTKGILDRLRAYRKFLQRNPNLSEKIVMIQIAVPSRTEILDYQKLKYEVEVMIEEIEESYEHQTLSPIRFLYRSLPLRSLIRFYECADIALVTPYFDGMNLVAKEYVAVKKDTGVLILSERAGAAHELSEALLINPRNPNEICLAIEEALQMNEEEKKQRMTAMYRRISRNDVYHWSDFFITQLSNVDTVESEDHTVYLSESHRARIFKSFANSFRRLILLDYDGTLHEITSLPMQAAPDAQLLDLLQKLTQLPNTEVAIVTGRERKDIVDWLGKLNLIFSAEHGLNIKWLHEQKWHNMTPPHTEKSWYRQIRNVLENYNRSTPGSFVEEKEASLTWHYRTVDPTLGKWKANELIIHLKNALANQPLEVVSGKMVVEVRLQGVNKGNIFDRMQELGKSYDFILGAGDDVTDEHLFEAMPKSSFSIKIGKHHSHADYRLNGVTEMRKLLEELVSL